MLKWRRAYAAVGALAVTIPAAAVAVAAGQADAQSAIPVDVSPHHVKFAGRLVVTGNASQANAGRTLKLQYAPASGTAWQTIKSTKVRSGGAFRFTTSLRRSGALRVETAPDTTSQDTLGSLAPATQSSPTLVASLPQRVTVTADLHVRRQSFDVLAGQRITVLGGLRPARVGRKVLLQGRTGGGWRTLASVRTGGGGGFHIGYVPNGTGQEQLRVKFGGDRFNNGATAPAGQVTVFGQGVASWYDDAGQTACGFHAYYGVANVSLPCGTRVTFHYGANQVTAVVDDRGPYVGGRQWDLNQNTASALGFGGVDAVWYSM
jgi:hypothetical protein